MKKYILLLVASLALASSAVAMHPCEGCAGCGGCGAAPAVIGDIEDLGAVVNAHIQMSGGAICELRRIAQAIRENRVADLGTIALCGSAGNILGCLLECVIPNMIEPGMDGRVVRAIAYLLDRGVPLLAVHGHAINLPERPELAQRINALLMQHHLIG